MPELVPQKLLHLFRWPKVLDEGGRKSELQQHRRTEGRLLLWSCEKIVIVIK